MNPGGFCPRQPHLPIPHSCVHSGASCCVLQGHISKDGSRAEGSRERPSSGLPLSLDEDIPVRGGAPSSPNMRQNEPTEGPSGLAHVHSHQHPSVPPLGSSVCATSSSPIGGSEPVSTRAWHRRQTPRRLSRKRRCRRALEAEVRAAEFGGG